MGWEKLAGGTYLRERKINDPQQGSIKSCICLASLGSLVWTGSTLFDNPAPVSQIEGFNYYEFRFYPGGAEKKVRVSERLCLDAGVPRFASSREAYELWVSLYEKAYAAFISGGRTNVLPGKDTFAMGNVAFGKNGSVTLAELSNRPCLDKAVDTFADGSEAYTFINGKSPTTKPMIAWSPAGAGVVDGIILDHTYSVLGVYNNTHIVLLDPMRGSAEPTGTYVLNDRIIQLGGKSIDLRNTADGIFAYDKTKFKSRFYKLAYATI